MVIAVTANPENYPLIFKALAAVRLSKSPKEASA
jgi:hypothetical protein